ncbi:MAG: NAD(P)H-binding protein [Spirochaetales bacterium]|nr:NAD(P)H-binding protein [Spirochaetales bacterium]
MKNDSETILVTGATGKVGRPLVGYLLEAGVRVRALTRNPAAANLPAGTEVVKGNLSDTASLAGLFDGVAAAHLVGFGDDYAPLVNGSAVMDLAMRAGVRKVTRLRGEVEKTPFDRAVEASDVEWTYLSPVEFMANTLEWAESMRSEGVVREGFADGKSACIHEADIAAVAAAVLTTDGHGGKEYRLTGPESLTPREKVRTLSTVLGRDISFIELSRDEMVATWSRDGWSKEDIDFFLAMIENPPIPGDVVLPTVEEVIGTPARTFSQWAREHAAAFIA